MCLWFCCLFLGLFPSWWIALFNSNMRNFPFLRISYFVLSAIVSWVFPLFWRGNQGGVEGRCVYEEVGGVEKGETVAGIYYMKEECIFFLYLVVCFYILTIDFPPSSPPRTSPNLLHALLIYSFSITIQKRPGIPQISTTKHGISSCSKTKCLPSNSGMKRQSLLKNMVVKANKRVTNSSCSHC